MNNIILDKIREYYLLKGKFNISVPMPDEIGEMDSWHTQKALDAWRKVKKERKFLLSKEESVVLYYALKKTREIDLPIAEVGVYEGGSASFMRKFTDKELYLFDTFGVYVAVYEGKKYVRTSEDKMTFGMNVFSLKEPFKEIENSNIFVGLFPETAKGIEQKFSFVHLDCDLYQSISDGLNFFYPRLETGGIILIHDIYLSGVRKALYDFGKPYLSIGNQGIIIK